MLSENLPCTRFLHTNQTCIYMIIKTPNSKEYRKIIRLLEARNAKFKTLSKWTDAMHIVDTGGEILEGYTL